MPYYGLLSLPYIPLRGNHCATDKRQSPYRLMHRIAYTCTERGGIPVILFYGAPFALLKDVCEPIYRWMSGKVRDLVIDHESSCRWRNGCCYWRTMVRIIGLDVQFISLHEFELFIISQIKRRCNCIVRRFRIETFVNL